MRAVKVSTLFCGSIVLKPANFKRQIVVISSPLAQRAANNRFISTDVVLLRRDRTWYRSFYLLKDSTVSVRVVAHHSLNVYWLKERNTLDKWTKEMSRHLKELSESSESFTGTRMAETFAISEDNNYYLGITSIAGNAKYSEIFVNISINRVEYDVSKYVTSCNASVGESCQVNLRFNSPDTSVLLVPRNSTTLHLQHVWVTWYCEPRIWFYTALFAGSLIFVVLVLALVYCCLMSRMKKKIRGCKPHVVAVRRENFSNENGGVRLTSVTYRGSISEANCETVLELTPLKLNQSWQDTENGEPSRPNHTATNRLNCVDGANNNFPHISGEMTSFNCANYADSVGKPQESPERSWRPPSPRWSTFLNEDDYEECVTNFRESPISTLDSIKKASEDDNFESELMDRFQECEPIETDIDDASSERYPFLDEEGNPDSDVVLRQKDKRREQRWEPRLSVVTEI